MRGMICALAAFWAWPIWAGEGVHTTFALVDFEAVGLLWAGGTGDRGGVGTAALNATEAHSGQRCLAFHYDFTGTTEIGYVYARLFPRLELPGGTQKVSFWVKGDGSGRNLNVRLKDARGETWQRHVARLDFTEWRQVAFPVTSEGASSWDGPEDASRGRLDPPATLAEIIVDKTTAAAPQTGVILLDDFEVEAILDRRELVEVKVVADDMVPGPRAGPIRARISATNRGPSKQKGRLYWHVADYRGKRVAVGKAEVTVDEHETAEVPVSLTIPQQGYFELSASFVSGRWHYRGRAPIRVMCPERPARAEPGCPIGINGHLASPEEMAMMRRGGIRWMRADWLWSVCQPQEGPFKWEVLDSRCEAARRNGIKLLPILCYGVEWASTKPPGAAGWAGNYMPQLGPWLNYVRAVVERYKRDITHWEVWNEPNIGFWLSSAEDYVRLLKATYAAIKQADPQAIVLMGGTAGAPTQYIEMLYAAGCKDFMDVVNIHPYQYPRMPDDGMAAAVQAVREVMQRYGDGDKPIWVTEVGYPNHIGPGGVDLRTQADYLARTYIVLLGAGVAKVFWYDYQNGDDPTYNEANFGIVFSDNRPKPCYFALRTVSDMLTGARFVEQAPAPGGVAAYRFRRSNGEVLCVWSQEGRKTLWMRAEGRVTLTDLMGNRRWVSARGATPLELDSSPLFVESAKPVCLADTLPLTATPCSADTYPTKSVPLRVAVHNPTDKALEVTLGAQVPQGWTVASFPRRLRLAPGESRMAGLDAISDPDVPYRAYRFRFRLTGRAEGARLRDTVTLTINAKPPWKVELRPGRENGKPTVVGYVTNQLGRTLRAVAWWAAPLCPAASSCGQCGRLTTFKPGQRVAVRLPDDWALEATQPPYWPLVLRLDDAEVQNAVYPGKFACAVAPRATEELLSRPLMTDDPLVLPLTLREQVQQISDWRGPRDLSAACLPLWTEECLVVRVRVWDDCFSQPFSGGDTWRGDGIQLAIDPAYEHTPAAPRAEYDVALTSHGPCVFRRTAPPGAPPKSAAQAAIQRTPDGASYEVRIPWAELGINPAPGTLIGLSLLVNDNDGNDRRGWIEWGSGIGWSKDPSQYLDVTLGP